MADAEAVVGYQMLVADIGCQASGQGLVVRFQISDGGYWVSAESLGGLDTESVLSSEIRHLPSNI